MPPPLVEGGPPSLPANLTALSSDQLVSALGSFSGFPPSQIQDSLQLLGTAALGAEGNFSFSTDEFTLGMKSLGVEPALLLSPGLEIAMPPLANLFPGAAAAAVIQWTTNPYANLTVAVPDAPVISLSVLDSTGAKISVKNLSKPISMNWDLKISPDDPRIQPPPAYVADCGHGILYIDDGVSFSKFHGAVVLGNSSWKVPCLLGIQANFKCVGSGGFQNFVCPSIAYEHDCMYWDSVVSNWSNDGCIAVSGTLTGVVCECTHLTDFSARLRAVEASNKAIFDNAGRVYSAAGLKEYAQWFGLFGGIAAVTLLIGAVVTYVDLASTRRYIHSLLRNKYLLEFLDRRPSSPLYIYDHHSSHDRYHKQKKETPPAKTISLSQRLLQQHPSLQFIFRYDPRLSRLFRLLFLFIVQFHSLFITALLYGFTYGVSGGKTTMTIPETILLSVMTMALTVPVVQVLLRGLNRVGTLEFQAQFPVLYEEYGRRANFEKIALVYLNKKEGLVLDPGFLKVAGVDDLLELPLKQLLKEMADVISKPWNLLNFPMGCWRMWPAHTWQGLLFLLSSFGYFGFILNYLILFAAAHDKSVGEQVMTSWGISQLSSIILIQPLTIVLTLGFYWILNRFSKFIPVCLQKNILIPAVRSIPSIFYFTNPWSAMSHSPLTAQFAYTLFTRCSAYASHADELAYAPIEAITTSVGVAEIADITVDTAPAEENTVKGLYEKFWKTFAELNR
jgi:hypothetical protein